MRVNWGFIAPYCTSGVIKWKPSNFCGAQRVSKRLENEKTAWIGASASKIKDGREEAGGFDLIFQSSLKWANGRNRPRVQL